MIVKLAVGTLDIFHDLKEYVYFNCTVGIIHSRLYYYYTVSVWKRDTADQDGYLYSRKVYVNYY
jgi:hypothetical protein